MNPLISGSLMVEGRVLTAGDFHHAASESDHREAWTDEGVEVLLVAAASDYLDFARSMKGWNQSRSASD
jgi:hypothetical protein